LGELLLEKRLENYPSGLLKERAGKISSLFPDLCLDDDDEIF